MMELIMGSESWNEVHRAVVCCICGKRGPGGVGDDQDARFVASSAGWWLRQIHARLAVAGLAGSCMNQMQVGGGSGHHVVYEEKAGLAHRSACPQCVATICDDTAPKKEQP